MFAAASATNPASTNAAKSAGTDAAKSAGTDAAKSPTTDTADPAFKIPRKKSWPSASSPSSASAPPTESPKSASKQAASAKQIDAVQTLDPQIIPNRRYVEGRIDEIFTNQSEERRKVTTMDAADKGTNSSSNYKQRPKDITYSGEATSGSNDIFIIESDTDVSITTEKGELSTASVRYIETNSGVGSRFALAAREIAKLWSVSDSNCQRSCPRGGMIHLGAKRGAGHKDHFFDGPTMHNINHPTSKNYNGINGHHANANIAANEIAMKHFPGARRSIKKYMGDDKTMPKVLGGGLGLCDDLMQSKDLENEHHVDCDESKCLSTWTTESSEHVDDPDWWHFVMPKLTCKIGGKKYKGMAVRLKHGAGIEWHGRKIFHCSTAPTDDRIGVNGTYFGVNRH